MLPSQTNSLPHDRAQIERRAVLLINTHSRKGQELCEPALFKLKELGVEIEKSVACEQREQMMAEAKAAVDRKVPIVIVGGGDGTLNTLADTVIDSESVLGVLPFGTGNAFARDLEISDIDVACRAIANGKISAVDVGVANGRPFLNVATVGLTTKIAQDLHESLKRKFGWLVYVSAAIRAFNEIKPFRVTLVTENGVHSFETLEVVIGNGRYHAGPFPLSPDAGIETGHFSIYALQKATKAAVIRLAVHLPSGTHVKLPEVHSESSTGGKLTARPNVKSIIDGDQGPMTPIDFQVRPRALQVLTPDGFAG